MSVRNTIGEKRVLTTNSGRPIMVTGATGLLGSRVVLHCLERGYPTAALVRGPAEFRGVEVLQADLRDPAAMISKLRQVYPAAVIHCAAMTDPNVCERNHGEAVAVNAKAPGILAEAVAGIGAKMLYVSTDSVFDGTRSQYSEDDSPNPLNCYASTKLDGERLVLRAHSRATVVRTNLFGWNARPKANLAEWIVRELEANRRITGFTDVIFNALPAETLAELLLEICERSLSGVYHVGSADSCSKYEFAIRIADRFGLARSLIAKGSIDNAPLATQRAKNTSLSTAKISATIGRLMPTMHAGIEVFATVRPRQ